MIVLFISQSEKKALTKTRQVLDMFADRIGTNTWKTNITKEGLNVVKQHLSKTASKNTSVACHWIHKSKNTELLWIVGSRAKFTSEGIVPIATTSKNILHNEWETKDTYLPIIKSLVALASLFHDVGKASSAFQKMLNNNKKSDIIRHEYISMLIFHLFVKNKDDKTWLNEFSTENFTNSLKEVSNLLKAKKLDIYSKKEQLSPLVTSLSYLIVSHHKKPFLLDKMKSNEFLGEEFDSINYFNNYINEKWGFVKNNEELYNNTFSSGLKLSSKWIKEVQKWSSRLLNQLELFNIIESKDILHLVLAKARLYLMLGDYYFSSQEKDEKYTSKSTLFANTTRETGIKKQYLEEHLLGVERESLKVIYSIERSILDFPIISEIKVLNRTSSKDSNFYWQDKVSKHLKTLKEEYKKDDGFFCVNLASTGTGKTFANAKIINSITPSDDNLRFSVALGLRSLTLQTGDMYRNKMHIDNTDLAVVIGSKAIEKLHKINSDEIEYNRSIFDEIDYENIIPDNALNNVIRDNKDKKFLCAPVCVCTIDHLMPAAEGIVGGHWIVPFIRLLSSDLIIDEIDDFVDSDIIAIARLVHLAGILGRRVIISSATITSSIAEGFYKAYAEGWKINNNYYNKNSNIITCFVDEFSYQEERNEIVKNNISYDVFNKNYEKFINNRINSIREKESVNGIKRKGNIIEFSKNDTFDDVSEIIINSIATLHKNNYIKDKQSDKNISIGLIRFAHINSCINFSRILESYELDNTDIRYLCYHSRNILLVRNEIENYLDKVLYRKSETDNIVDFTDTNMRFHIDNSKKDNIVFVVISTPIEEVGRDHDFDWAIVEPSSIRSIIQLSGRVLRHRVKNSVETNVSILEYNLESLKDNQDIIFRNPGYENSKNKLHSHDLKEIIDVKTINKSINSIPRLKETVEQNAESLIKIEHNSIRDSLLNNKSFGPENLNGYYYNFWYLTGLPQIYSPFRASEKNERIYCIFDEDDNLFKFYKKDNRGNKSEITNLNKIHFIENKISKSWIVLDYENLIDKYKEILNMSYEKLVDTFSYIDIPISLLEKNYDWDYSEILGLNRR